MFQFPLSNDKARKFLKVETICLIISMSKMAFTPRIKFCKGISLNSSTIRRISFLVGEMAHSSTRGMGLLSSF